MKYAVHALDVWGNAEDGYNVNDVYPSSGTITLEAEQDLVDVLRQEGYITKPIDETELEVYGEPEYTLYVNYKGRPELELRAVEGQP